MVESSTAVPGGQTDSGSGGRSSNERSAGHGPLPDEALRRYPGARGAQGRDVVLGVRADDLRAGSSGAGLPTIEAEVAQLAPEDQGDYLASLGLTETGLARVVHAGYQLLDLVTFFTVGPKEARAWTVRREARAP